MPRLEDLRAITERSPPRRGGRAIAALAVALALGLFAPVAIARPGDGVSGAAPHARARAGRSRSVGLPWRGRLERGVAVRESEHLRLLPEYAEGGNHYGTSQLVRLLERAAERVARRVPGSRLSVGELSAERGGRLDGHRSHESGRDVDIAFYLTNAAGQPREVYAFAEIGADGRGRGANRMFRFDDARNWELVGRLITDGEARVQHVFVSNAIKQRLLREARRRRAPASVIARATEVMGQPSHGHPHANHFHVRVYCDPRDRPRCEDEAPFHGWYPGVPPS